MALYQGLSHKPVTFQHLEEFLVALGQKEPVMLSAEQPEKTVLTVDQPRKETLYLYKKYLGLRPHGNRGAGRLSGSGKESRHFRRFHRKRLRCGNTLSIRRKSETAAITAELRCVRENRSFALNWK